MCAPVKVPNQRGLNVACYISGQPSFLYIYIYAVCLDLLLCKNVPMFQGLHCACGSLSVQASGAGTLKRHSSNPRQSRSYLVKRRCPPLRPERSSQGHSSRCGPASTEGVRGQQGVDSLIMGCLADDLGGDNLRQGDVGASQEADEAHDGDEQVLH